MSQLIRIGSLVAVLCFVLFAGWRIVGQMQAERYQKVDPERALAWRPHDPRAMLVLAERQLVQGDLTSAQANARNLLAHEPLHGEAFRVLAEVAERQGHRAEAFQLYRIAERRAPRGLPTRAWLIQRFLEMGEYTQALAQVDRVLRMSPKLATRIHPVLVQMAQNATFAEALAKSLRADPPWRRGILAALRNPKTGSPEAAGQVMGALQQQGGLSTEEYAGWLDSLMAQGRWGEAYARWAGGVPKPGGRLPLVYNGDFAHVPSDSGFDWRLRRVPGVLLQFEQAAGMPGQAAYVRFLDRRIPSAGVEHPLLLSPGQYRLSLRARAQALRSALGLQWVIACAGGGSVVGRTDPVEGSFGWRPFEATFAIPDTACPAQWLRLINPVAAGSAQRVAGDLWFSEVKISPQKK